MPSSAPTILHSLRIISLSNSLQSLKTELFDLEPVFCINVKMYTKSLMNILMRRSRDVVVPPLISNSKSEKHQDLAWKAVCPSVLLLRKFYDFALELETALCELLTVLCSPEMTALQHLENQQVECVCVCVCVCVWREGDVSGGVGGTYGVCGVWKCVSV